MRPRLEAIERMNDLAIASPMLWRWYPLRARRRRIIGLPWRWRPLTLIVWPVVHCGISYRRPPRTALTIALPMLDATDRMIDFVKVSP